MERLVYNIPGQYYHMQHYNMPSLFLLAFYFFAYTFKYHLKFQVIEVHAEFFVSCDP